MLTSWRRWLAPLVGFLVVLAVALYLVNVNAPAEPKHRAEERNLAVLASEYNLTTFGTVAQGCRYFGSFLEAEEFYRITLEACDGYRDRKTTFLTPERFGYYGFITCARFYLDQNRQKVFCCAQIATYPTSDYNYWREKCGGVNAS